MQSFYRPKTLTVHRTYKFSSSTEACNPGPGRSRAREEWRTFPPPSPAIGASVGPGGTPRRSPLLFGGSGFSCSFTPLAFLRKKPSRDCRLYWAGCWVVVSSTEPLLRRPSLTFTPDSANHDDFKHAIHDRPASTLRR